MRYESWADDAHASRRFTRRRLAVAAALTTGAVLATGAIAKATAYSFGTPTRSAAPAVIKAAPMAPTQTAPKAAGTGQVMDDMAGGDAMAADGGTMMTKKPAAKKMAMGNGAMGMTMAADAMNLGAMGNGTTGNGFMGKTFMGSNTWTNTFMQQHPYTFRTFSTRNDLTFVQLLGINDRGRIVGYYGSGADAMHPNKGFSLLSPYGARNLIKQNYPRSTQTQVVAINGFGATAGFYVDGTGANFGFVNWNGQFITVVNPSTPMMRPFNQLLGINNNGIAVGFYNDTAGNSHGYWYNVRTGTFGRYRIPVMATSVVVTGINDRGDISGFYTVGKVTRAFLIVRNHFIKISLGSGRNTQALGLNNKDQVVGSFTDRKGKMHGFVWWNGHLSQVDALRSTGTLVNGINNRGVIVGFFVDRRGSTVGFIASRRA